MIQTSKDNEIIYRDPESESDFEKEEDDPETENAITEFDQSRCFPVKKSTAKATSGLARCVCGWKNCRAFQKAYREYGHPVLDGVIKMKFVKGDTLSQSFKNLIDRTLKVSKDKRLDWKPGRKRGEEAIITYKIARHHFTEEHVLRYLNDAKSYRWTKLFTTAEAKKYLFQLEQHKDSIERSDVDADLNYFQCPNVSKEYVKNQFLRMKHGERRRKSLASRASIVCASESIKALPREIELAEEEASNRESDRDDTSMQVLLDDRSYARSHSRTSERYDDYDDWKRRQRRDNSRQNRDRNRYPPHDKRAGGGGCDDIDTYEVKKQFIVDPYGERGTYAGSLSKASGMPHGKGRLQYNAVAGRWYEGDWKHGRWTGHGRLSNGDGDLYEGGFRNDYKHGKGTMRFADGRVFVGEYTNGRMIEGRMAYADGSAYDGSWVDGMRHGRGRCVFTDKSVYEGDFSKGEFHGNGKMSWADGGWYQGEWWNGDMQGRGKEVRPDGSVRHDGQWSKGNPIRNRR